MEVEVDFGADGRGYFHFGNVDAQSRRLLFGLALATLVLMYAASVRDRELVHIIARGLDGPVLVVLLGLGVGSLRPSRSRRGRR